MKPLATVVCVAATLLTAAPATAAVLDFEGISTEDFEEMPNGYGGLVWDNFYVMNRAYAPDSGYDTGTVSGEYTAFNAFSEPAGISAPAGSTFTFNSGYFTAAWNDELEILIEGFTEGDTLADYTAQLSLSTTGPEFFTAGWTDLWQLRFTPLNDDLFGMIAMDDLDITLSGPTDVPEPLPLGLLGLGFAGIVGARRRKG